MFFMNTYKGERWKARGSIHPSALAGSGLARTCSLPPYPPGLFHFDASFRPVPLELSFVGVSVDNFAARNNMMHEICYNKVG